MINICSCAKRLVFDEFVTFVEALAEDHFHAAEHLMQALDGLLQIVRPSIPESTGVATNLSTQRPDLASFPGVRLQNRDRFASQTNSPNSSICSEFPQGSSYPSTASPASSLGASSVFHNQRRSQCENSLTVSNSVSGAHGFQEMLSPLSPPNNQSGMSRLSSGSTMSQNYTSSNGTSMYSYQGPPGGFFFGKKKK
ncbi:hypothetical protein ElyMa_001334400 [Elysia marginata]|uniref:Uncharacterized protein n=1 Tax=Elysia marginata TaxID=1093978 RepID=A0AAV4IQB3_9GAST|nr:hypothetical protein ElyMa_001334400 [Elysia marginata]